MADNAAETDNKFHDAELPETCRNIAGVWREN